MKRLLFLFSLLLGGMAIAQTVLPCTTGCPARYYWELQPCASGSCSRSYAPLPTEFPSKGMSLQGQEGAALMLCASPGYTLSGTGTVRIWAWEAGVPNDVAPNKVLELSVADVVPTGTPCGFTTATDGGVVSGVGAGDAGVNLTYACRCTRWLDWAVGGASARRVVAEAVGVGVSGGSLLEVRWSGLGVQ